MKEIEKLAEEVQTFEEFTKMPRIDLYEEHSSKELWQEAMNVLCKLMPPDIHGEDEDCEEIQSLILELGYRADKLQQCQLDRYQKAMEHLEEKFEKDYQRFKQEYKAEIDTDALSCAMSEYESDREKATEAQKQPAMSLEECKNKVSKDLQYNDWKDLTLKSANQNPAEIYHDAVAELFANQFREEQKWDGIENIVSQTIKTVLENVYAEIEYEDFHDFSKGVKGAILGGNDFDDLKHEVMSKLGSLPSPPNKEG